VTDKVHNNGDRQRKYNNPRDLDELCKGFLETKDADKGAAIEYCKNFLSVLTEKPPVTGAVLSSRAKSR
jgi:hypothetical protein